MSREFDAATLEPRSPVIEKEGTWQTMAAVAPGGQWVEIWNLDVDAWAGIACRAAGRNMTRAEWDQFGPRDKEYRATCPQWPAAV